MIEADWSYASRIVSEDPGVDSTVVPAQVLREIGPFAVEAELGRGAMGQVYRVRYQGQSYALKLILKDTAHSRSRLQREAQLVGELEHPGIVRLHGAGTVAGYSFLLYELVSDGRPFDAADLDLPARVELIGHVADAVGYAHSRGVVHRDLKPANILMDPAGVVHVIDFGLATHADLTGMTQTGALLGTPRYMAPEQFHAERTKQTPAVDVWSLGVLLYETLTGRLPHTAATLLELAAALASAPPPRPSKLNPAVPLALDEVCLRALSYAQEDRQPTASVFARDLREALDAAPVSPWPRRVAGALVVGVLVLAGVMFAQWRGRAAPWPASVEQGALDFEDPFGLLLGGESGASLLQRARARLQADPSDLAAQVAEAAALQELEDYTGSVSVAESVLRESPLNLVALRALAGSLYRLRRFDEALAACDRARALDPDSAFGLIYASLIECDLGNHARGLELAERAVAARPDSGEALAARGAARLVSGDAAGSLVDLTAAIELQDIPDVRLNRANALLRLGKHAEAMQDLEQIREDLGENPIWQASRLLCLIELEPDQAEREARDLAQAFPERADLRYFLGEAQRLQGDPASASESFRRAVELQPESQWARAAARKLSQLER